MNNGKQSAKTVVEFEGQIQFSVSWDGQEISGISPLTTKTLEVVVEQLEYCLEIAKKELEKKREAI